jgi:hypothetical protein
MVRDQGVTRVLSAVQITMPLATTPEVALAVMVMAAAAAAAAVAVVAVAVALVARMDQKMMAWEPMTAQSMRTAEL